MLDEIKRNILSPLRTNGIDHMKGFAEGIIVSPSYQSLTSNQSLEDKSLASQLHIIRQHALSTNGAKPLHHMCGASARGLNRVGGLYKYHFICGKIQIVDIEGVFLSKQCKYVVIC